MRGLLLIAGLLFSLAESHGQTPSLGPEHPADGQVWRYGYEILKTYPHDPKAFTQGLVYLNGKLLESTGLNGRSTLREVDLNSGKVLRQVTVPEQYFAEGLSILDGKAYQLTWLAHKGFVYDEATFHLEHEFTYSGEGWGLATDGHSFILSDGTPIIRYFDPATFAVTRTIKVNVHGQPVDQLNELEYIHGEIFANVWKTPFVVRISPNDGAVTGVIDFAGLLTPTERTNTDVLNGIAYDNPGDCLFITGKLWPKLFQVRLICPNSPAVKKALQ